jgi:membrane-associated phospholipid phosphatase
MRTHIAVALFILSLGIAGLTAGDVPISRYIAHHHQPYLDHFFAWVTHLGEAPAMISVALCILAVHRRLLVGYTLHLIITWAVSQSMKALVARPRPRLVFDQLQQLEHLQTVGGLTILRGINSFPSGHTITAFALAAFLSQWTAHRPILIIIWLILAGSVGLSRIYLLNHFATDVAAGACIGWLIGLLGYKFAELQSNWSR